MQADGENTFAKTTEISGSFDITKDAKNNKSAKYESGCGRRGKFLKPMKKFTVLEKAFSSAKPHPDGRRRYFLLSSQSSSLKKGALCEEKKVLCSEGKEHQYEPEKSM